VTITGIVLAGGAASRFGADKLAAELDGRPLLHHALLALAGVTDVALVVIAPEAADPAIPAGLSVPVHLVHDPAPHRGPLAGLASALAALGATGPAGPAVAPGTTDGQGRQGDLADVTGDIALVVGGDMPGLVPAVLRLMVATLAADPSLGAVVLEADLPSVLPIAVRVSLVGRAVGDLLAEDRRALRGVLDRVPWLALPAATWRRLDPAGATLFDVDRPEDMAR
jgi:molybdopterin-guanine dinucleotide biosynthesis protein A